MVIKSKQAKPKRPTHHNQVPTAPPSRPNNIRKMNFQSMLSKLKHDVSQHPQRQKLPKAPEESSSQPPTKRHKTEQLNETIKDSHHLHYPFPKRNVSTIYLCTPNVQTGGPEAMHQLCHKINSLSFELNLNITAYLLFVKENQNQPELVKNSKILRAYETIYSNLKIATSFPMPTNNNDNSKKNIGKEEGAVGDDNNEDLLYNNSLIIWPECWTHLIDSFQPTKSDDGRSKRYQTAIWWLSVNNNNSKFKEWNRQDILHFYQSEYARCYLIDNIIHKHIKTSNNEKKILEGNDNGIIASATHKNQHNIVSADAPPILPMTEFIHESRCGDNEILCDDSTILSNKNRSLQIVYNPFKGVHYTDSIIRRSGSKFSFTPIGSIQKRIAPKDVNKLLQAAKVYIDFGEHPGMDRLPREAALAGCIVITNTEGAAYYEEDVPIPKEYKVKKFDVDVIHRLLSSSLDNYSEKCKDFDSYRSWIHKQETRMDKCVKDFLTKVSTRCTR